MATDSCQDAAGFAPGGEESNFNDPGLRDTTIAVSVVLIVTTVILTYGRLHANFQKLSLSDAFVLLATLLLIAEGATMIAFVRYFRHPWNIPQCWLDGDYVLRTYVWQILYIFQQFFAKTAIFMLFYEIFNLSTGMRIAVRVGIAFTFAFYVTGLTVVSYFGAPLIGHSWDSLVGTLGLDVVNSIWGMAVGVVNVIFDIYIFILPLPMVYKLKLSLKRKIQVFAVFLVGLLGVVASVIAMAYRLRAVFSYDPYATYNGGVLMICNISEMGTALIVCTTPGFAKFIRVHVMKSSAFERFRSTVTGSSGINLSRTGRFLGTPHQSRIQTENTGELERGGLGYSGGHAAMSDTSLPTTAAIPRDITVDYEMPKHN